ncbi:MAG: hypothetical protein V7L01_02245 [Nostoc sp.]
MSNHLIYNYSSGHDTNIMPPKSLILHAAAKRSQQLISSLLNH